MPRLGRFTSIRKRRSVSADSWPVSSAKVCLFFRGVIADAAHHAANGHVLGIGIVLGNESDVGGDAGNPGVAREIADFISAALALGARLGAE